MATCCLCASAWRGDCRVCPPLSGPWSLVYLLVCDLPEYMTKDEK